MILERRSNPIFNRIGEFLLTKWFGLPKVYFEHEGYQFAIRYMPTDLPKEVCVFPPENKNEIAVPIKFFVTSQDDLCHGEIIGIYYRGGKDSSHFQSLRTRNFQRERPLHVPNIMGTAIGEIVTHSRDLHWNSSMELLDGGKIMYERLMQQTHDPNSCFFGKITVDYYKEIGFFQIKKK